LVDDVGDVSEDLLAVRLVEDLVPGARTGLRVRRRAAQRPEPLPAGRQGHQAVVLRYSSGCCPTLPASVIVRIACCSPSRVGRTKSPCHASGSTASSAPTAGSREKVEASSLMGPSCPQHPRRAWRGRIWR